MVEDKQEILQLNLDDIIPNRFQPREVFDEKALKELAASIKEHGVIQPIIVRNVNGKYEIIAGERRYKASALAGKTTIPAIIKNLDDKESSKVALLENLQRKNLNPIEEAKTYQKILELDEMTQEDLAKTMGKSQSAVSNKLRLLQLSDKVQQAVLKEEISERHARTLLRIDDSKKQVEMLNKVIAEKINVRDLEKLIDEMYPKKKKEEEAEEENISINNNFINTTPLDTTIKIQNPNEGYGEIKILPPEGEDSNTAMPKFLNYGEINDEEDDEEESKNNFFNSIEPIDINNMKQNTQDINNNNSSSSSSLDSLLNLQSNTDNSQNNYLTPSEAIVKTTTEEPDDKVEDYFKSSNLPNISLPDEVRTTNSSDTSLKDVIDDMNKKELENQPLTLDRAKEELKELVKRFQDKSLKVKTDEMDFEKSYQMIIKIEKE